MRELASVIGRALITMRPSEMTIETEHLPLFECEKIGHAVVGAPAGTSRTLNEMIAEAEKTAIERALDEAGGNREQAAKLLGMAVRNLNYNLRKYAITS